MILYKGKAKYMREHIEKLLAEYGNISLDKLEEMVKCQGLELNKK